ncbi:predicted protein [Uncinocarpus reesii 1704]|uniref:Uncharacterized protein n=1 Tax=Uncinocarpus reesii (strain UAMH 1704) TaxID=336963 RepID=C4JEY5_UNCRE|nr:uncharacterized protein UREG_00886 [Uncinocarpus reesii 1704]EEP76038.1 predicted protein [Uncinocarpus reesii 1704]
MRFCHSTFPDQETHAFCGPEASTAAGTRVQEPLESRLLHRKIRKETAMTIVEATEQRNSLARELRDPALVDRTGSVPSRKNAGRRSQTGVNHAVLRQRNRRIGRCDRAARPGKKSRITPARPSPNTSPVHRDSAALETAPVLPPCKDAQAHASCNPNGELKTYRGLARKSSSNRASALW